MPSSQPIPYNQPLPPQRGGILPTNQFWAHAFLTTAGLALWAGLTVYVVLANAFGLSWWSAALCFMVFYSGWGGLLERWTRRALVARRRQLLREELNQTGTLNSILAPAVPPKMPPLGASPEFRDFAYHRLFGRGSFCVQGAQSIGVTLLLFYPSLTAFCLAMILLFGESIALGRWERRMRRGPFRVLPPDKQPEQVPAGPPGPSGAPTSAAAGGHASAMEASEVTREATATSMVATS